VRRVGPYRWERSTYKSGAWKDNYYSVRVLGQHSDVVTGKQMLFASAGRAGIAAGELNGKKHGGVDWGPNTETGLLRTRPLGLAKLGGRLYISAGSLILRRNDGPSPTWTTVFDMLVHDKVTVDESIGGIRGLSPIDHRGGQSLIFAWCATPVSPSCINRLDPDGAGFKMTTEACVKTEVRKSLKAEAAKNLKDYEPLIGFSIAAYNDVLKVPWMGRHYALIGFEVMFHHWTGAENALTPYQIRDKKTNLGFYAGAGYLIRKSAEKYELREVGGKRRPWNVDPTLVATRCYARSPFGDSGIFFGGHDSNYFPANDTAWIAYGTAEAAYAAPTP